MSVKKHFGCRVMKPETAKLSHSTYAEITPTSRKNSSFNRQPIIKDWITDNKPQSNEGVDLLMNHLLERLQPLVDEFREDLTAYQEFRKKVESDSKFAEQERRKFADFTAASAIEEVLSEMQDEQEKQMYRTIIENREFPSDFSEKSIAVLTEFYHNLEEIKNASVECMLEAMMPAFLAEWQSMNNTSSVEMTNSDIMECFLNSEYFPYHSMKWSLKQQELALYNFDLNMAYFNALDRDKFNGEIDTFLKEHPAFREVTDLNEYKDVSGIYIMVLDEYKQVYISYSYGIKTSISKHWTRNIPLDLLIFKDVRYSVLNIDLFKHLDTTRIFVMPSNSSTDSLYDITQDLQDNGFSPEFVLQHLRRLS